MHILRKLFLEARRNGPPEVPSSTADTGHTATSDADSPTADENLAPDVHPGTPGENHGREVIARFGRFGTVELHDQRFPDAEEIGPEKQRQRAAITAAKKDAKAQGRGAGAVPSDICADLVSRLPFDINTRFIEEENPGGFQQLSTEQKKATIAIMMAKRYSPNSYSAESSSYSPDALLIVFDALLSMGIEEKVTTARQCGLEALTRSAQPPTDSETLARIGSKHPYQGKSNADISRELQGHIDKEVKRHTAKIPKLNRKMSLESWEHNVLLCIVLATHQVTKDLSLMDLLNLYGQFKQYDPLRSR